MKIVETGLKVCVVFITESESDHFPVLVSSSEALAKLEIFTAIIRLTGKQLAVRSCRDGNISMFVEITIVVTDGTINQTGPLQFRSRNC